MGRDFKELNGHELCPCNSGQVYKKCCKKKKIKWGYKDGTLTKSIPMDKEVIRILKMQEQLFIDLYGRKWLKDELLFTFASISENEIGVEMVHTMRKSSIPEDIIYAYYKSGLLPTEFNMDLIPEADLEEFNFFCKEYNDLISAPICDNQVNVLQWVIFSNDYITEVYEHCNQALIMVMYDFINRHKKRDSFLDYEISNVIEYCIFSLYKTIKILTSVKKLLDEHMTESIYALSRGLFENYMYINATNQDNEFFQSKILPKADTKNYSFETKPDGTIDYNKVKHNSTGEPINIRVNIADLRKYFVKSKDHELYELFYRTASQYIHVDVLSAKAYFHESDPYDEIDQSLMASIIAVTLAVLLLMQISHADGVDPQFTKDALFVFNNIKPELLTCFELANSDSLHKNAAFETFYKRLEEEV